MQKQRKRKNKSAKKAKIEEIRMVHANVNGIGMKNRSLQNVADLFQANVVSLNETKQRPQKLKGFGAWYSKERKNREGGWSVLGFVMPFQWR